VTPESIFGGFILLKWELMCPGLDNYETNRKKWGKHKTMSNIGIFVGKAVYGKRAQLARSKKAALTDCGSLYLRFMWSKLIDDFQNAARWFLLAHQLAWGDVPPTLAIFNSRLTYQMPLMANKLLRWQDLGDSKLRWKPIVVQAIRWYLVCLSELQGNTNSW